MKITLAEVKSLEKGLSKIFEKDVNVKIAYKLSKLLKILTEEMENLEEQRRKLVQKYGEKQGDTEQFAVPQDKAQDFYKEFTELMQVEIDVDFEPIPLSAFGEISLSAADVMSLDNKIIFDDSEANE